MIESMWTQTQDISIHLKNIFFKIIEILMFLCALKILFHICIKSSQANEMNSKMKGCDLVRGVQQPISWSTENQLATILIILINCCANVLRKSQDPASLM